MSKAIHRAGFVSIAGRPNAGKSTLLNALIGEKVAIVARQPQTTRTSVQGVLTTPDAQIVFVDTPGIHRSDTLFNKRMMDSVRGAVQDRDLVLYIADATKPVTEEDEHAVSAIKSAEKTVLVLNKVDALEDKRMVLPKTEEYLNLHAFSEVVPASARTGNGIERLREVIISYLPEDPAIYPEDYLTDQPMRFIAAEIIRERILHNASQEVPHASAILIDEWEESPKLVKISASIHVERPGQKAILIGKEGRLMKKIGTEAREQLERMLERKVFLSLFVKVHPHWREDPQFLQSIDWRSMLGSEEK